MQSPTWGRVCGEILGKYQHAFQNSMSEHSRGPQLNLRTHQTNLRMQISHIAQRTDSFDFYSDEKYFLFCILSQIYHLLLPPRRSPACVTRRGQSHEILGEVKRYIDVSQVLVLLEGQSLYLSKEGYRVRESVASHHGGESFALRIFPFS